MNATVAQLINEQINKEFYSAYLYLDFANWFYALALGGLYFLCGNALSAAVYLAIFAVVTAAGSALLLHWVKQRGARIFAAL